MARTYFKIDLTNIEGFYSFNVVLNQADFLFEIKYNNRAKKWIFDLYNSDGENLIYGKALKVCKGSALLELVADDSKPEGSLFVVPLTNPPVDPDEDTINKDTILVYAEV